MSDYMCHDFKTPRTDMSRRLPSSMRAVPVMFYLATLFAAYSVFNDYRGYNTAEQQRREAVARKEELGSATDKLAEEKSKIEEERFRAEAVAKWVEGTRVLQPVSVAIARAMPVETNISELSLERSPDLPAQISLLVRMSNGGLSEIAKIESTVGRLHYRVHSPQQSKTGDQIEFRSMLVWQE